MAPVTRATYYNWTLPAGATIISGAGTNTITVVFGAGFTTAGTLSVQACNSCGCSPPRSRTINRNPVSVPDPIAGLQNGVCGTTGFYSTNPDPAATSYSWSLGASVGASFTTPTNGLTVGVSFTSSFVTATLSVTATNGCGSATRTLVIKGAPTMPGPITGPLTVCVNTTYPFSVTTVTGTTTYTWTAPGPITGQGSKNITVSYGGSISSALVVTVKATNSCGTSPMRSLNGISSVFCPRMGDAEMNISGLQIYPNPAHDKLNVEFRADDGDQYSLQLFDLTGRLVVNENGTGHGNNIPRVLDVRQLAKGSYMIQLKTNQGVSQKQVILE